MFKKVTLVRLSWLYLPILLVCCTAQHKIGKQAKNLLINKQELAAAHVGIAVFDVERNRNMYVHNAEQLFIPASNTKLFSCYAAMKYLGDSLLAATYSIDGERLLLQAAGDPTFLHPDFKRQPLFDLMKQPQFSTIVLYTPFSSQPLGKGWAWDDFTEDYMAERDPFPIYGNLATFSFDGDTLRTVPPNLPVLGKPLKNEPWNVERNLGGHFYTINNKQGTKAPVKVITMPMEQGAFAARYLQDTLHKDVEGTTKLPGKNITKIFSQPTDSLLRMMMHRSDNFFAEQTLLMVSNARLGIMSDTKIIDTLLKDDFKQLPQKPRWVDGSGLSRYNLFSPNDFTWVLSKMKNEFGLERMKTILPSGNAGTLKGLYTNREKNIYAKTGTVSNNLALSGYLLTAKNKLLIFSVMVNNHTAAASLVRKDIEQFLTGLIDRY